VNGTHQVTNQPSPLAGYDVFGSDAVLREAVHREGGGWAAAELRELGCWPGTKPGSIAVSRPTSIRPGYAVTIGTVTGSTRSSTTRPGTS
jgi:hypothetical protein